MGTCSYGFGGQRRLHHGTQRFGAGAVHPINGRMRDELLNETLFFDIDDARTKIAAWITDYNDERPHSALGYLTPAAYAATLTATALGSATPTSFADRPLLDIRRAAYKPLRL
jgi:transposase InsO family protein